MTGKTLRTKIRRYSLQEESKINTRVGHPQVQDDGQRRRHALNIHAAVVALMMSRTMANPGPRMPSNASSRRDRRLFAEIRLNAVRCPEMTMTTVYARSSWAEMRMTPPPGMALLMTLSFRSAV